MQPGDSTGSVTGDVVPGAAVGATEPLKRAVLYLRVSTERQARSGGEAEGYSIPAQREAGRRKAESLGALTGKMRC